MRYADASRQELLVSSPQFPALVLVHNTYDKAPFHWHPGFELLYAKDCPLTVSMGETVVYVKPGEVFLVPPSTMHAVNMLDDGAVSPRALSVTINPAEMVSVFPEILRVQQLVNYRDCNMHASVLSEESDTLYARLEQPSATRFLSANAAFYVLMTKIFDHFAVLHQMENDTDREAQTISLIYRFIQNRFLGPLTTTEVARHFGYSREYFSRLFKKYTGVSCKEYITELRLRVACEQLRDSDVSVRQIADMSGFPNEKSLRQVFDRKFGCTPTQYRCNERQNPDRIW